MRAWAVCRGFLMPSLIVGALMVDFSTRRVQRLRIFPVLTGNVSNTAQHSRRVIFDSCFRAACWRGCGLDILSDWLWGEFIRFIFLNSFLWAPSRVPLRSILAVHCFFPTGPIGESDTRHLVGTFRTAIGLSASVAVQPLLSPNQSLKSNPIGRLPIVRHLQLIRR